MQKTTKAAYKPVTRACSRLDGCIDRGSHALCQAWRAPWLDRPNKSSKVGWISAPLPLASPGTKYHIRPMFVNRRAPGVFGNGHRAGGAATCLFIARHVGAPSIRAGNEGRARPGPGCSVLAGGRGSGRPARSLGKVVTERPPEIVGGGGGSLNGATDP
jgi:hypothetical protein